MTYSMISCPLTYRFMLDKEEIVEFSAFVFSLYLSFLFFFFFLFFER